MACISVFVGWLHISSCLLSKPFVSALILQVTKLERDPSSGNALQEISFWLNLEKALQRVQEKTKSIDVTLTLDILKFAKRFHAVVSFDSDTGIFIKPCWTLVTVHYCCHAELGWEMLSKVKQVFRNC